MSCRWPRLSSVTSLHLVSVLASVCLLTVGTPQSRAQPAPPAAFPRMPEGGPAYERNCAPAELRVEYFWIELGWATAGTAPIVGLRLSVRLSAAPTDWLQVAARVPDGYRVLQYQSGEWVPFYLLTHSPTAEVELRLQWSASAPVLVDFPVLVHVGSWRQWMRVYLRGSPEGYAAAAVLIDSCGQPLWFRGSQTGVAAGEPGSFWALPTSVGESLLFVSEVMAVPIDMPGYLSPWCGLGTSPPTLDSLLNQVSHHAGCAARRADDGRYVVSFAESYRGAPDASWFVAREGQELRYHAEGTPAVRLLPALLEAAGETMGDSPDLVWSRVDHGWSGSFQAVLASVCAHAEPPLRWEPRSGAHYFELASRPDAGSE